MNKICCYFLIICLSIWITENELDGYGDIVDFCLQVCSMNSNEVGKLRSPITSISFQNKLTTHCEMNHVFSYGKFDYYSHPPTEEIQSYNLIINNVECLFYNKSLYGSYSIFILWSYGSIKMALRLTKKNSIV